MRRLGLLAAMTGGLLMFAGVAFAVNQYSATSSIQPAKSGTVSSPKPVSASLTFRVTDSNPANRPSPLKTYSIGLGAGIVPNTLLFSGCSFSQASVNVSSPSQLNTACRRGIVGSGSVKAVVGAASDPTQMISCYLDVTLINSNRKNHLNIRIDSRDAPGTPSNFTCALPQHSAIDATYVRTGQAVAAARSARAAAVLPIYAIKFTVPDNLLHTAAGDSTVVSNVSRILKKTTRVRNKTRGYLESIGCPRTPAGRRVAVVVFTDLSGRRSATQSTSPCVK